MAKGKKLTMDEIERLLKLSVEDFIFWLTEEMGQDAETVKHLIANSDGIKGCSFVSIAGYSSDKSNNTEISDCVVNIGSNYEKQVEKSVKAYGEIKPSELDADAFDYDSIDLDGMELTAFKKEVKQNFPLALMELQNPKTGSRADNNYRFNKAVMFNLSTLNWLIGGTLVSKTIEQEGIYKRQKSAPLTIAKQIAKNYAGTPTSKIRTYKVGNILATVSLKGDTIIVAGLEKDGK